MSIYQDPLEAWSARLADGEAIDWGDAREALPAEEFARLRELAELAGTMRQVDAPGTAIGERWGHLEIRERLGRGSFGDVLLAFDSILQRDVALKLRRTDAPGAPPEAWIEEARQLARVRHPNVLAVHGADIRDGVPGLWADRIEGATLRDQVHDTTLRFNEVLVIAHQLASAVAAVHGHGLVHGDLKPGNVMIETDGRVVLMDFGTVRPQGGRGRAAGSPAVMSPERLNGGPPSQADDVYALGAVFAFLVGGRYPFEADSVEELQSLHGRRSAPDLGTRRLPRAWRRLLRSMLATDPENRPSLDRVIEQLERLRSAPARRRRLAALSTIIGLLALGLAIALTAYVRVRDAEGETAAVNSVLRDVLAAPRGTEQGRNVRVVDVLDRAVPEAERRFGDELPLALARVRALVGRTWVSLGLEARAEGLLDEAHAEYVRRFGPDDPRTVELLDPMARVHEHLGRLESAGALWREMIARSAGTRPAVRANAIAARTGLAAMMLRENRLDDAEALLTEALTLADAAATAGATDRAEVNARMLLALVQVRSGRLEAAEASAGQALATSLRVNGERHTNTLIARDRLIELLYRRGDLETAEPLARQNLETTLDWLGENELRTIMAQNALSNILHDRGRMDEALALLEDAIRGAEQTLPEDSAQRLTLEANRVSRYLEMGRPEDAVEQARRVARALDAADRPAGQLAWVNRLNLADGLLQTDRPEAALREAAEARRAIVERLGDANPLAWIAASYEGNALNAVGRAAEAAALLEPALADLTEGLGPTHTQTLIAAGWRAGNLASLGRTEEALAMAERTRAATVEQVGPSHVRVGRLDALIERLRTETPPDPD